MKNSRLHSSLLASAAATMALGTGAVQAAPPPARSRVNQRTKNALLQMEIAAHNEEVERKKREKKAAKLLRRLKSLP